MLRSLKRSDKLLEAQRLAQRTNYDTEMLEDYRLLQWYRELLAPFRWACSSEPPYTLIDYFPKDMICIIDESHVTVPQIRSMYEGDRSRKGYAGRSQFRLPSALDRPLRLTI